MYAWTMYMCSEGLGVLLSMTQQMGIDFKYKPISTDVQN